MADTTKPTPVILAFRTKVAAAAQHSKYIKRLSKDEERVMRAGLDALKKPEAGDPRRLVFLALKAKAKDVGLSRGQLRTLIHMVGPILDLAYIATQNGDNAKEKAAGKVVPIKRNTPTGKPPSGSNKASAS